MPSTAICWRRRLAVLAIATSWLTACAGVGFDCRATVVCPPVAEYNREEQQLVADGVEALPEDSVIVGWLADYAVLRQQLRLCQGR